MALLLYAWPSNAPGLERFFISDFYLANPPLLHKTSMTAQVRAEFSKLEVPRPDKTFLSFPMPPLLFHKMEPIQKQALQALLGKGIVGAPEYKRGSVVLTPFGKDFVKAELSEETTELEGKLLPFLTTHFASLGEGSTADLRRRTGLRRFA
jgi:hypothetical protein